MKKIYFTLAFIFSLFIMAFSVCAYDIAVKDENGNIYNHDGNKFYLPSHISPTEVEFLVDEDTSFYYTDANGNQVAVLNGQKIDVTPFANEYNEHSVYILTAKIDDMDSFVTMRFANTLPSVYLTTSLGDDYYTGAEYIIKYDYKDTGALASIINNDGSIEFTDTLGNSEFKIRGNTTRDYAKKPFQLKLSEKADLFGMGRSKTWILLANYLDQSLLRNSVMYELGAYLGMQASDFVSVDLFIDGQYYGVYLLCEKVQISNARLDIHELEKDNDLLNATYNQYVTSVTTGELIDSTILTQYSYISGVVNPDDITGGYLVELDNNYYRNELCYFTTENNNHYVIKSPEYASREQVEYIAFLFAEMEEAIMSDDGYNSLGKHYTEYIDIDSFAVAYIIAELGRNYDAGSSSMYFYKDRDTDGTTSKIFKGPLWDCDNTLGNIHKNSASSTEGYWAKSRSIWSGLTAKVEFNEVVSQKFADAYDYIFDMIDAGGFIDKEIAKIGDSIYMEQHRWGSNDYSKWPVYYDGTHYDKWQSSPVFNFIDTYSQGNNEDSSTVIGYLCEHIEARTNWLATEWACDVAIRERKIVPDDSTDTETEADTSTEIETETNTSTEFDSNSDVELDTDTKTDIIIDSSSDEVFNTDVITDTEININTDIIVDGDKDNIVIIEKQSFFDWLFGLIKSFFDKLFSIFK
ncbi:MAG: CotH kinase family protein [Clostridia bacterium]|nr:CotH kinase family protein [Clostridia bacterium]